MLEWIPALSRRVAAMFVALALVAISCGGTGTAPVESEAAPATPAPTAVVETAEEPEATPEAVETPEEPADPWEVLTVTAGESTGMVHPGDASFRYIELYDEPEGDQLQFDVPVLNPTYFGGELALMVTEGDVGDAWVKVQLPVRPNGSEAWIRTDGFAFDAHSYHATVDLSDYHVEVFEGDDLIAETGAVIGRDDAPTPVGRWFVNDKIPGGGGAYGSWILSLSAFSETLETFKGGLPVIAIHGTNSPQDIGQALSSGCVRVPNDVVEFLVDELPLGTPVDVVV